MSVSPLVLSPKHAPAPARHASVSPASAPSRNGSPPSLSTEFWHISQESGCVPSLQVAYNSKTKQWWGGRLDFPLSEYEQLVDDLPNVLGSPNGGGELDRRLAELPRLDLFASKSQQDQQDQQRVNSTRPQTVHAANCVCCCLYVVVLDSTLKRENAFALFAYLANAFVFSRTSQAQSIAIPPQIAQPLLRLTNWLERMPITDYASCVLSNWRLKDLHLGMSLENLDIRHTFTGTEAEKWFYAIHCVIEYQGGEAFSSMQHSREVIKTFRMIHKLQGGSEHTALAFQRSVHHANQFSIQRHTFSTTPATSTNTSPSGLKLLTPTMPDPNSSLFVNTCMETCRKVTKDLNTLERSIALMRDTISRLPEHCPADLFFDQIRPWVSSWPECGVYYADYCSCQSLSKENELVKCHGASGAQSTLFPCIDAFLGISYPSSEQARTDLGAFIRQLKQFRKSMPPMHRDLIVEFESLAAGNVKDLIAWIAEHVLDLHELGGETPETVAKLQDMLELLKSAYNRVIATLVVFRRKHIEFATGYIKTMAAKRAAAVPSTPQLSSIPQPGIAVQANKGTGGSDYANHLARHLSDTKQALYKNQD
ncbi:hypothetical protein BASA81_012916 [Batrachochytrium salamandrivorans]|nr:hypothetical protein BASA81_012916 [Batrachochytrium salamandrivorans]